MRSVFVTGTGTGVGKTVATAALCAATGATPMKPAQTGATRPADLEFVAAATGVALRDPAAQCPYVLAEPLAPAVAARRAGVRIDPARIAECFASLPQPVVVEGAGGLLVPLTGEATMADLASLLRLPVLVVAAPGLGTLNATALTVEAARRRGLEVLGVVVCGARDDPDLAERTNRDELPKIAPVLATIPFVDGLDVDACRPAGLRDRIPPEIASVGAG